MVDRSGKAARSIGGVTVPGHGGATVPCRGGATVPCRGGATVPCRGGATVPRPAAMDRGIAVCGGASSDATCDVRRGGCGVRGVRCLACGVGPAWLLDPLYDYDVRPPIIEIGGRWPVIGDRRAGGRSYRKRRMGTTATSRARCSKERRFQRLSWISVAAATSSSKWPSRMAVNFCSSTASMISSS